MRIAFKENMNQRIKIQNSNDTNQKPKPTNIITYYQNNSKLSPREGEGIIS